MISTPLLVFMLAELINGLIILGENLMRQVALLNDSGSRPSQQDADM